MKFNSILILFVHFLTLNVFADDSFVRYSKEQICRDTKNYLSLEELESAADRPAPGYSFFEIDDQQSQLLQTVSNAPMPMDLLKKELLTNKNLFFCDDNSEGQGTANEIVIELSGLNCVVKFVYGYEYGNDEDPLGMFDIWSSPREGFNCKVVGLLNEEKNKAVNFELSRFYKTKRFTCSQNNQNLKHFSEVTRPIQAFCN